MAVTDLSGVPTEVLETYLVMISEDDEGLDPDAAFAAEISAIYRMRDFEGAGHEVRGASTDDVQAELGRRRGDPPPPELMTYREARAAIVRELGSMPPWLAAHYFGQLQVIIVKDRRRYLAADVRALIDKETQL